MEEIIEQKSKEMIEEKANGIYLEMLQIPEVKEALDILDSLPNNLRYHNKEHTLDVIRETILFALADGALPEIIKEQAISAAWHDVGYVKRYENNEPIAIKMFKKSMAYKSLPKDARNRIIADILDTQMKMINGSPYLIKDKSLYGYILDADVSNFGRDDYFEKWMKVAEELNIDLNNPETKKKFYKFAIDLLKNHEWKTESARRLRQSKNEENLRMMEREYVLL
jgi:hypothetical protein